MRVVVALAVLAFISLGGRAEARPAARVSGFVQLPASGTGYYSYTSSYRRWGTPRMVYGLIRTGKGWRAGHPSYPRIGVGDISLRYGGPISGHVSHRYGVDVDVRPVRTTGEGPTSYGWSTYSRSRTAHLLVSHVKPNFSVRVVFFNDPALYKPYGWIQYWPNHANHFHLRIW